MSPFILASKCIFGITALVGQMSRYVWIFLNEALSPIVTMSGTNEE